MPVATADHVRVADDVELALRRWDGAAAPGFLLVHGLASSARLWDGVAEVLTRGGHAVAAVDLRGHGGSAKPDHGYDVATVAGDLVAVLDHLGWERPIAVGQSWGGNVVVELATRAPARLGGVAGIDGGTIELADRFPSWDECAALLAPPHLEGTIAAELVERFRSAHQDWPESGIEGFLACFDVADDGTVAPWLTRARHMAILRGLWDHRPSTLWERLNVPMLLVPARPTAGEPWPEVVAAHDVAAERVSRVRVEWMAGDHDLHAQHPEEIARVLVGCVEDGFFR